MTLRRKLRRAGVVSIKWILSLILLIIDLIYSTPAVQDKWKLEYLQRLKSIKGNMLSFHLKSNNTHVGQSANASSGVPLPCPMPLRDGQRSRPRAVLWAPREFGHYLLWKHTTSVTEPVSNKNLPLFNLYTYVPWSFYILWEGRLRVGLKTWGCRKPTSITCLGRGWGSIPQ